LSPDSISGIDQRIRDVSLGSGSQAAVGIFNGPVNFLSSKSQDRVLWNLSLSRFLASSKDTTSDFEGAGTAFSKINIRDVKGS